ncbi:hypothetical protein K432DRAFT_403323 [Lepidopterella palustris CBS 459.81]|uniref:Uncharacterized protein n=1 Tax=Lepidopterella palustris CBS 459.81 TaxID=1314670 RepID=A0A8E2EEA4_9PEZI|nr:hypothetical protein K432DRAFT_403323 [Lepidopterella palustris CBS 459.81]
MFQCPQLYSLFESPNPPDCLIEDRETDPISIGELPEGSDSSKAKSKVADIILSGVADWLELNERDNGWAVRRRQLRRFLPTPNEIAAHLTSRPFTTSEAAESPEDSEVLLHLIAIQILASCFTLSHPPSASHMPLYLGKKGPELITSLRLHAQYRFSPAAGHHARNSSRESAWPGLFSGPSIEDRLADEVSRRRLMKKRNTEVTMNKISAWSRELHDLADGPTSSHEHEPVTRRTSIPYSVTSNLPDEGCLSTVGVWYSRIANDKAPKVRTEQPRKNPNFISSALHDAQLQHGHRPHLNHPNQRYLPNRSVRPILPTESQPILPQLVEDFSLHRHHTVPRRSHHPSVSSQLYSRRNSSTPAILEQARDINVAIPEIRRMPTSTAETNDLITAHDFLDESRLSPGHLVTCGHAELPWIELEPVPSEEALVPTSPDFDHVQFARTFSFPHGESLTPVPSVSSTVNDARIEREERMDREANVSVVINEDQTYDFGWESGDSEDSADKHDKR